MSIDLLDLRRCTKDEPLLLLKRISWCVAVGDVRDYVAQLDLY